MKSTQTIIVGCMVVSVTNAAVANLSDSTNKSPAIKILIGGWIITIGLLLASEVQPELAEAFAILIVLASVFGPNGTVFADLLGRLTTNPKLGVSPVKGKTVDATSTEAGGTPVAGSLVSGTARAVGIKAGVIKPTLVPIPGMGGLLLDVSAVPAYLKAVEYYGKPIPLSGTWISEAAHKAAYDANPNGTLGATSLHPKGLAVDVDQSINLRDPALYAAFTKAGWYRRGKKILQYGVLQPELWHYSFGVPG